MREPTRPSWAGGAVAALRLRVLGSYAAFFVRNLPRALWPRTFAHHLRRKMLFDRRPLLQTTADKVRVRGYVRDKVGDHVLKKVYAITADPRSIDWSALPRTFACKASHASGGAVIVSDTAPPDARLPAGADAGWQRFFVRPDHASPDRLVPICDHWLRRRYGWGPGTTHEHHYRRIPPRIVVEELLLGRDGQVPHDYEFFVFHGRCELIEVLGDRMTGLRLDRFLPDWTRLDLEANTPPADVPPSRPRNLAEMIRIAEALGAPFDFVRVDLFDLGDRIVFSELTHAPMAGKPSRDPAYDRMLAGFWARGAKRQERR